MREGGRDRGRVCVRERARKSTFPELQSRVEIVYKHCPGHVWHIIHVNKMHYVRREGKTRWVELGRSPAHWQQLFKTKPKLKVGDGEGWVDVGREIRGALLVCWWYRSDH